MPVTPFHFGPGLLGKGIAAPWYSWTAFVASNIVIDCESAYYLSRGTWPVHRQLHTFLGAGLVGVATAITLIGIFALLPRLSAAMRAEASRVGIVVGSMAGALSHPVLDGLMHQDIEPLQPWSASNPFRELISLQTLHLGCLAAGAVGLVLLVVWKRPDQGAAP